MKKDAILYFVWAVQTIILFVLFLGLAIFVKDNTEIKHEKLIINEFEEFIDVEKYGYSLFEIEGDFNLEVDGAYYLLLSYENNTELYLVYVKNNDVDWEKVK